MKGSRASTDVGIMFIVKNLRRIMNTMTGERLKEYLGGTLVPDFRFYRPYKGCFQKS